MYNYHGDLCYNHSTVAYRNGLFERNIEFRTLKAADNAIYLYQLNNMALVAVWIVIGKRIKQNP